MDKRLLNAVICPACRGELEFSGEDDEKRIYSGEFCCLGCGLLFPVIEEVPILVPPETDMSGVYRDEAGATEWVQRNFERALKGWEGPLERKFIEAARSIDGIVLDIGTGPGGSYCVQIMQDGRTDRLLVMNDLGAPVMLAWRRHLRAVGWGERCSNMVFDARRMPFRDGSVAAITSALGLQSVIGDRLAYAEASRVLQAGGQMLDVVRLYEEGGPTQRRFKEWGEIASWSDYTALLEGLGFTVERWDILVTGRGKSDPGDEVPICDDETWENRVIFAVRR